MNSNLAYQEEWREELIGGEVVAMAPATPQHNYIAGNIHYVFKHYIRQKKGKCIPFQDGTAVRLSEENSFIPDFMVVCDRSTAKNDKWHKKNVYESSGVPEYWIVSPREKSIEVYLLQDGQYVLDNIYTYFSPEDMEDMTEEEKNGLVTEFRCHLYDDLIIRLDDIFGDLF